MDRCGRERLTCIVCIVCAGPSSGNGAGPQVQKRESKGEDPISNWKLFNDLENREEADVVRLHAHIHSFIIIPSVW